MFGVEQNPAPNFSLVLTITFLGAVAMAHEFARPARYESRDLLLKFFDKYIYINIFTLWNENR